MHGARAVLLAAALLVVSTCLSPASAGAESSGAGDVLSKPAPSPAPTGLTISPLIFDLSLRPGQSATREVTVVAAGLDALDIVFEHSDLGFRGDTYEQQFIPDDVEDTTEFSTRDWFSVPRPQFHLKRGGSLIVPLRITAPKNATPGTHLGVAFFRTLPQAGFDPATSVQTSARVGALVFVNVIGGTTPAPRIRNFSSDRLLQDGPINIRLKIGNAGRRFFRMSGDITVSGPSGTDTIPLGSHYIVPGLDREIRDGERPLRLDRRHLSAGRYTLRLAVKIDPGGKKLTATIHIWIVPVWLRLLLAALLVGTVAGVAWVAHRVRQMVPAGDVAVADDGNAGDDTDDGDPEGADADPSG